jgi:hypothetical protein
MRDARERQRNDPRDPQAPRHRARFLRVGATGAMEPRISGRLVDYLVRHPLPTNVRELEALLLVMRKYGIKKGDPEE